jgi:glycine cleavage system H protein
MPLFKILGAIMNPKNLLYTEQHEYAGVDGDIATVGISDYAQENLGDITFIELPSVGKELKQGDEACSIESAKAASSIYAPLSGKVAAVNEALEDDPAPINDDPYGAGWIFKIELSNPSEKDKLMDAAAYDAMAKE